MRLDINNNEVVRFTAKLEQLRKSALPNAIRSTLNSAAFDVKQKTMPAQAQEQFTNRSPNFFKANSSVAMATGWDVNKMRATVGFIETKLRLGGGGAGGTNFSVQDLEQQEHSGAIAGKSYVPLDEARVAGHNTLVKPMNRLTKILKSGRVVMAGFTRSSLATKKTIRTHGNKKQLFVEAIHLAGAGGYVIGGKTKGGNILWRVDSINGPNKFSLTALYDYRSGRRVKVKEKGFMQTASLKSADKLNGLFIANAKFWINKYAK